MLTKLYYVTDYDDDDHDYTGDSGGVTQPPKPYRNVYPDEDSYFNRKIEKEYETIYRACDKKTNLYILQQNLFIQGTILPTQGKSNCSR